MASFAAWTHSEEILVVEIPVVAAPEGGVSPFDRYVDGVRIVRVDLQTNSKRSMTDGFASACDPAVSPDGKWILFAARRQPGDPWQVWRMAVDGSQIHQITRTAGSSVSPLWVGALFHLDDDQPTDRILYVETTHDEHETGSHGVHTALFTSDHDGGRPWRITHGLGSALDPEVVSETGRVVFASYVRPSSEDTSSPTASLMAVNSDGTDLMAYHVDHQRRVVMRSPRVTRDGRLVFVENGAGGWLGGGRLAVVSRRRPLKTHRVLADDPEGLYTDPAPLEDGGMLASFRSRTEGTAYELFRVDPETGRREGRVHSRSGFHCVDAHEISPWPVPKGRSSVVNMAKDTGVFYCLSSHITDRPELGFLRNRPARAVRVLEGRSATAGVGQGPPRILGVAPVEDDGSFHIEVPAQIPITFQLLDEHGMAVAGQHSWVWVMPREWRGCVGCHEDREMVAPNVLAEAVVKPAVALTLPPERRRTVDFVNDVVPVMARSCAGSSCHGSAAIALPVDTDDARRAAYGRLMGKGVVRGSAAESAVIWHLMGRDGPQRGDLGAVGGGQTFDRVDRAVFVEWIDLGAWFDVESAAGEGSVAP